MCNITTGTIEPINEPLKENDNRTFIFDLNANDVEAELDKDSLIVTVRGKKLSPKDSIIQSIIEAKTPDDVDKLFNDIVSSPLKLRAIAVEYNRRNKIEVSAEHIAKIIGATGTCRCPKGIE